MQQLCTFLTQKPAPNANARNGSLIGLAGMGIALGQEIATYLDQMIGPVLACFSDADPKTRYFACESFYNLAKVCKGEMLVYFNEIFVVLARLAADSEVSVKNGAELLDRLFKDIVCEAAPHYVSMYQDVSQLRARQDRDIGVEGGENELQVAREKAAHERYAKAMHLEHDRRSTSMNKAFSLARFVPFLAERMQVVSPLTRNYIVSWIAVLDSVPDLQLVAYLSTFLPHLFQYLSDPNTDVRVATAEVLANFLREIREAAQHQEPPLSGSREASRLSHAAMDKNAPSHVSSAALSASSASPGSAPSQSNAPVLASASDSAPGSPSSTTFGPTSDPGSHAGPVSDSGPAPTRDLDVHANDDELVWVNGGRVRVEYDAILEILLEQVQNQDEEIQATTFEWITEFLHVVPSMVVPFAPRLISAVLPCLAHPAPAIQSAAIRTNKQLFTAVERLLPNEDAPASNAAEGTSNPSAVGGGSGGGLDYFATTHALKQHLLDQHDQARLNALEWLIMLHAKCPTKLFSIHDGSISVLLRALSDPSEDVILCDMRLLAQICSRADEHHFRQFLTDLLHLFATDRKLLESWGSLIIRQLCVKLQMERVFFVLAEILESYEDLEFASIMVQNLNMLLAASQELKPLRRRIRALDTREDQQLFIRLYRCWSHNAISALCLCLLTQSYEHAYNILRIFADLDVSLSMLLQIDKLVQLIESPIFTSLRLQLLEPQQNPFLFKCLYGMLMLLPQSSAFATLRNRLHAVNGLGQVALPPDPSSRPHSAYLSNASQASSGPAGAHANANMPSSSTTTSSSSSSSSSPASSSTPASRYSRSSATSSAAATTHNIPWKELLAHFRSVQMRHERLRLASSSSTSTAAGVPGVPGIPGSIAVHTPTGFPGSGSAVFPDGGSHRTRELFLSSTNSSREPSISVSHRDDVVSRRRRGEGAAPFSSSSALRTSALGLGSVTPANVGTRLARE